MSCGSKVSGTTLGATDSGIDSCGGEPDDDVWYKFTAVGTSHVVSWSNNNAVTGYDFLSFQIFSGSCGTLINALCSNNEAMAVVNGLTPGETYYIRIYSTGDGYNTFDICVGTIPPPPANDECSGAITLAVNPDMNCAGKLSGNTVSATDSGIAACEGEANDDIWYKFTAVGTSHVITLSNTDFIFGYDSPLFEVFSGSCGTLTSILCSDFEDYKVINGLTPGQTYYVRVFGADQWYVSFDICVGTIPPPPANDACSGALAATVFPYSYTQSDAAGATNNNGFVEVCSGNEMNDGTWFTFTGNGGTFDISVSMPAGSYFDPGIGVYSGSCNSLTCEGTVNDEEIGETEKISVSTVAGTVYYVNVGYYNGITDLLEGTFTITITNDSLGTSEVSVEKEKIRAYPNPFSETLNITDISKVQSIIISDSSGRQVKNIAAPSSVLHLGDLKQGMYFISLKMKDGSIQTIKAIKK